MKWKSSESIYGLSAEVEALRKWEGQMEEVEVSSGLRSWLLSNGSFPWALSVISSRKSSALQEECVCDDV